MLRSDAILPGSRCDRVSGRKLCVGFPTRHGETATPVSESGRLGLKEVARVRARTAPGGRHEKTQGPGGCCSWVLCHHAALWAGDRRRVSWVLEGRGPGRLPAGERVHSPAHTHTHAHVCTSTHTPTASSHTRTPTVTDTHEVSPCELPSTGGDSSPWLEAPGGSGQVGGVGRVPSPWALDTHQSLEGGGDRPARDSPLLGGPTRHSAGGGPSHPNHCPTPRARPLRVRI